MWELNTFRRLIPAFAILVIGIIMYMGVKYTTNALMNVYCATTDDPRLDPTTWGLAYWIFGLFGIITMWVFILRAWLTIKGRLSGEMGGGETERKKKKPPTEFPPMSPYGGE